MKVLKVICIIFLIIGLLATAIFFATKSVVQKEYDSLDNLKSDATETEVLKSKSLLRTVFSISSSTAPMTSKLLRSTRRT